MKKILIILMAFITLMSTACKNTESQSADVPDKGDTASKALSSQKSFAFRARQRLNDSDDIEREFKEVLRVSAIAMDPFIKGIDSGVTSDTVRRLGAPKTASDWRFALERAVRINEMDEQEQQETELDEIGRVLDKHAVDYGGYGSGDVEDLAPLMKAFKACDRFSVIAKEASNQRSRQANSLAAANRQIVELLSEITSEYIEYRLWCSDTYDKQVGLARMLLDNGNLWNPDFRSTFATLDELAIELIAKDKRLNMLKPRIQRVQVEVEKIVREIDRD